MKALSLKQPWGNLVASRMKWLETRVWSTKYRGKLLIVSSKRHDRDALEYFTYQIGIIKDGLAAGVKVDTDAAMNATLLEKAIGDGENPAGSALAVVDLVDCRPMVKSDERGACCGVYPGAFVWVFDNIRKVKPVPVVGALKIYECQLEESDLTFF